MPSQSLATVLFTEESILTLVDTMDSILYDYDEDSIHPIHEIIVEWTLSLLGNLLVQGVIHSYDKHLLPISNITGENPIILWLFQHYKLNTSVQRTATYILCLLVNTLPDLPEIIPSLLFEHLPDHLLSDRETRNERVVCGTILCMVIANHCPERETVIFKMRTWEQEIRETYTGSEEESEFLTAVRSM